MTSSNLVSISSLTSTPSLPSPQKRDGGGDTGNKCGSVIVYLPAYLHPKRGLSTGLSLSHFLSSSTVNILSSLSETQWVNAWNEEK